MKHHIFQPHGDISGAIKTGSHQVLFRNYGHIICREYAVLQGGTVCFAYAVWLLCICSVPRVRNIADLMGSSFCIHHLTICIGVDLMLLKITCFIKYGFARHGHNTQHFQVSCILASALNSIKATRYTKFPEKCKSFKYLRTITTKNPYNTTQIIGVREMEQEAILFWCSFLSP